MAPRPRSSSSAPRPSKATVAYSGLVTALALASLFAPFVPGLAARMALGGVLIAAAVLAVVVELAQLVEGRATFWLRLLWACLGAAAGGVLMFSSQADRISQLTLAAFLLAQSAILGVCAMRARRLKELGGLPLGAEGVLTLALAVFVLAAFPFDQSWVLAAIVAVGLLDYAAALSFLAVEEREQELGQA